jgi:hypothetical protein
MSAAIALTLTTRMATLAGTRCGGSLIPRKENALIEARHIVRLAKFSSRVLCALRRGFRRTIEGAATRRLEGPSAGISGSWFEQLVLAEPAERDRQVAIQRRRHVTNGATVALLIVSVATGRARVPPPAHIAQPGSHTGQHAPGRLFSLHRPNISRRARIGLVREILAPSEASIEGECQLRIATIDGTVIGASAQCSDDN